MLLYLLSDLLCNLVLEQFNQGSAHASSGYLLQMSFQGMLPSQVMFSGIFSQGEFPVSTNIARVNSGLYSGVRGGMTKLRFHPEVENIGMFRVPRNYPGSKCCPLIFFKKILI